MRVFPPDWRHPAAQRALTYFRFSFVHLHSFTRHVLFHNAVAGIIPAVVQFTPGINGTRELSLRNCKTTDTSRIKQLKNCSELLV